MTRAALVVAFAIAALAAASFVGEGADAAGANRAGLVIAFPGHTQTVWVEFAEAEISGRELLERSGLQVTFSSFGGLGEAVCKIEDVGCANPNDCFCQCQSGSCAYWAYFSLKNGEWAYQPLGISKRMLRDGDVDGWAWGAGTPPPDVAAPKPCPTPTAPPPVAPPPATTAPNPATGAAPADPGAPPPANGLLQPAQDQPGAPAPASTPTPGEASGAATAAPKPNAAVDAVRRFDRTDGGEDAPEAVVGASQGPESGGGAPYGLIAFGAVAAAMAAAVGAVAVGRRLRG
jgi:hypothetical protein